MPTVSIIDKYADKTVTDFPKWMKKSLYDTIDKPDNEINVLRIYSTFIYYEYNDPTKVDAILILAPGLIGSMIDALNRMIIMNDEKWAEKWAYDIAFKMFDIQKNRLFDN